MVDVNTKEIISLFQAKGSEHDFTMFKASFGAISEQHLLLADSGYQGLYDYHAHSRIPYKKSKHHPLTCEQKKFNRELSRERIVIENINARIKTFKIMSERYRNRRRRHFLRMNLICAALNLELNA